MLKGKDIGSSIYIDIVNLQQDLCWHHHSYYLVFFARLRKKTGSSNVIGYFKVR